MQLHIQQLGSKPLVELKQSHTYWCTHTKWYSNLIKIGSKWNIYLKEFIYNLLEFILRLCKCLNEHMKITYNTFMHYFQLISTSFIRQLIKTTYNSCELFNHISSSIIGTIYAQVLRW